MDSNVCTTPEAQPETVAIAGIIGQGLSEDALQLIVGAVLILALSAGDVIAKEDGA